MSNLLRNKESTEKVDGLTEHVVVDNNAISIIQIYGSDSMALNEYDDLIEYAESSDYEQDDKISDRDKNAPSLTSNGVMQNDDVQTDNNAISIIHLYGQNSVTLNDGEDLIEYADSSDHEHDSNRLMQVDDVQTGNKAIPIIHSYGQYSVALNGDEDLIEYAEPSDNEEVDDQIFKESAHTNSPSIISPNDEIRNEDYEDIQVVFGSNDFPIDDVDDLVAESTSDDEVGPLNISNAAASVDSSTGEINFVDNDSGDDTPVVYKGRPKRGRKRKIPEQSRTDRKKLYNTNKKHFNTKGNIVHERHFDENFVCQCSKKCTDVVSLEQRTRFFNQFWSMGTFSGRCAMLLKCVIEKPKKRSYSKKPMKKRLASRKFTMLGHNVCKVAVLRTLQINSKRIDLALQKQNFCDSLADLRGIAGGVNAYPVSKRIEVRAHISSFPKYISHYTRSQTDSKFLSSCLNLARMYALYYLEAEDPVGKTFYKRVFYDDFNLRFKKPKKDTCLKCDVYAVKIRNPTLSEEDRRILEEWHNDHLEIAESLRTQMYKDLSTAKTMNSCEVFTFDFQKILSAPRLTTSIVYYKRQLNLYNFGLHVGSTGKGIFNVWMETEASKGTQEVGSCLRKHISTIDGPKNLILWSDACGGQNRSIKLILMLIHILQNHETLETISIRYLQSGHSFLPNDSEFGDFECSLKQAGQLFTDAEFIKIMENCRVRNKFKVQRMSRQDFFSVKYLEREITNRKIDINKNKINWLDTHEILLEKSQPGIIKMRKKIDGPFQIVNIEKRNGDMTNFGDIELNELWPEGRPLSKEKVADLKEILKLVPEEHKSYYSFLDSTPVGDFIDDIEGYGEVTDFIIENEEF